MTEFLDLPYELRKIVYSNVLKNIIAGRERILWVPDVLEQDINHQALAITYRRARNFSPQEPNIFVWLGDRWPTARHRDIASFVSLARTCQALHTEVLGFAWKASDFKVQGTLDMIRELLRHRLALHMSVVTKSFITSLELIITKPWEMDSLEAMKDIVQMVNAHLPALEVLTLSIPEIAVIYGPYAHTPEMSKVVELLTPNYAIIRAKAIDRQRKKIENDCLNPDYYIYMTLGLRSSTHYETIQCCFDHKIQNHLRKIYLPGLKMTTRCASPDLDDRTLLLISGVENGLVRTKTEQD